MTLKSILTASVAALALSVGTPGWSGDALAGGGEKAPLSAKVGATQPATTAPVATAPSTSQQAPGNDDDDDDDDDDEDDDEEDDDEEDDDQ